MHCECKRKDTPENMAREVSPGDAPGSPPENPLSQICDEEFQISKEYPKDVLLVTCI